MKPEELVGQRIAEFRERLGMTQQELGEQLEPLLGRSWTRQAVSTAEKGGRAFTATELFALAHVLNTWPNRLLIPPAGTTAVVMPAGTPLAGKNLYDWAYSTSDEAVEMARDALDNVIHRFSQRVQVDQDELERLASLYEALEQALNPKSYASEEGSTDG